MADRTRSQIQLDQMHDLQQPSHTHKPYECFDILFGENVLSEEHQVQPGKNFLRRSTMKRWQAVYEARLDWTACVAKKSQTLGVGHHILHVISVYVSISF